jgi:hypothetical protein
MHLNVASSMAARRHPDAPQFVPQPGQPALWELDSDYYLWSKGGQGGLG